MGMRLFSYFEPCKPMTFQPLLRTLQAYDISTFTLSFIYKN